MLESKLIADATARLPIGTVLPFDPVVRAPDGAKTGELRRIPSGWQICDGSNGTPDLNNSFLQGVNAVNEAGSTGGNNAIPSQGGHTHSTSSAGPSGKDIICSGKCYGRYIAHTHTTTDPGGHNHGGENRPKYYSVNYICKSR